ncbi:MAG: nodulation protein NfeD [Myxococcales bacterium]|nr:nodulation protein NfeD [Myxococcales bacterium]
MTLRGWVLTGLLLLGALGVAAETETGPTERSGHVAIARIQGSINPASSDYLQRAIEQAETEGAVLLVLELDTPGGLVASTKDIIQAMLGARVPIVVFVSPQGAWAGSAGTFITLAAHVAAMAPGSSIGAAHPVGIGGGGGGGAEDEEGKTTDVSAEKAENLLAAFIESIAAERDRNVEWAEKAVRESVAVTADEALELNVIDLVANNRADLLAQLDGRELVLQGKPIRLAVAGAEQREIEMTALTRFLNVLVDPNVAVILLMAGALGLYIEFNQPGTFVPGIVGAICLLLALIAMQILPFSWLGLLLIGVGLALFVAELFVTSYGLLFAGGVACFLLGGSMLFDMPEVSDLNVSFWSVLVPATIGMASFAALVVVAVGRSLGLPQAAGVGEMLGMVGRATTDLDPTGTVFVRGEFWRVRAEEPVSAESSVEVVGVEGLELVVRPSRNPR